MSNQANRTHAWDPDARDAVSDVNLFSVRIAEPLTALLDDKSNVKKCFPGDNPSVIAAKTRRMCT